MVETRAELPFIGDQIVCLSHDQAARSGPARKRGAPIGLHSHQGDPTIVYVLEGILTNHHDDGTTEEFRAGQVFTEFGPRSHWIENKGPTPVTFIAANIHRRD